MKNRRISLRLVTQGERARRRRGVDGDRCSCKYAYMMRICREGELGRGTGTHTHTTASSDRLFDCYSSSYALHVLHVEGENRPDVMGDGSRDSLGIIHVGRETRHNQHDRGNHQQFTSCPGVCTDDGVELLCLL